jgi:hypothetical protein
LIDTLLRYVVKNRVHVDIGSLCLLLDCLCGLFALSRAYQTRALHDVIIPRSWLLGLWRDFNKFKDLPSHSYLIIADVIQQLLEDVSVGNFISGVFFGWFSEVPDQ